MKTITHPKKEIRLKVENKFYKLLQNNANIFGVRTSEYIVHLIINDIKNTPTFLSDEAELAIEESYNEVISAKKNGQFKIESAKEILKSLY